MKFRATIKEFELEFEYIKEYGVRSMRSGGRSQTFEIRAAKFDLSRDCLYFHTSIHLHLHTYFIPVVFFFLLVHLSIFTLYIQLVQHSIGTTFCSLEHSQCPFSHGHQYNISFSQLLFILNTLIHLDRCFWQL